MIGMTAAVGALLIIACLVGFTFYMLLSEHNKAQSRAERSTLGLAKILNKDDRVGQVNNVIARSRELVFYQGAINRQQWTRNYQIGNRLLVF